MLQPPKKQIEINGFIEDISDLADLCAKITPGKHDQASIAVFIRLRKLARRDTSLIRASLVAFQKDINKDYPRRMRYWWAIYIMNRYIFALPAKVRIGEFRSLAGFSPPVVDNMVSPIWPISSEEPQTLLSRGGSYLGSPYDFIKEFDYFRKKYPRRRRMCYR